MKLKSLFTRFKTEEDGAVTVDWVVLTAGLVGLAALLGGYLVTGVNEAGTKIQGGMTAANPFGSESSTPAQ